MFILSRRLVESLDKYQYSLRGVIHSPLVEALFGSGLWVAIKVIPHYFVNVSQAYLEHWQVDVLVSYVA